MKESRPAFVRSTSGDCVAGASMCLSMIAERRTS